MLKKLFIITLLGFNFSSGSAFAAAQCGRFDYACANKNIRRDVTILEKFYDQTTQFTKKNISTLRSRIPTQEMMSNLDDVEKSVVEINKIVHDEKVDLYIKTESLRTASVFKEYRMNGALSHYVDVLDTSIKGLREINETLKIANHELGYDSL